MHVLLSDPVSLDEAITRALNVDDISYRNRVMPNPLPRKETSCQQYDEAEPMEINDLRIKGKK